MKTKIVLLNARANDDIYQPHLKRVPINLLTLASMFHEEEDNYDFKFVNVDRYPDESFKKEMIEVTEGALCFGISSMTGYQIKESLDFAKIIKKHYPDMLIVWGGWHASILPHETIKDPNVDIIVKSQGQRTFYELVKALENKTDLRNVKGILFKENGEVIETPNKEFEDINNFPPIPYHLFEKTKEYVDDLERLDGTRLIHYVSSQGCPFACKFCVEKIVSNRRWKAVGVDRMLQDVDNLVKNYDVNEMIFYDSLFFVNKRRVIDFCQGIIDRGYKIKFSNLNGRTHILNDFTDEEWEIMQKAGISGILIGAESGSQKILDMINKAATVEDTIRTVEITKKYGIDLTISLMVGLPPERQEDLDEELNLTLDMIERIIKIRNDNNFLLFIYLPYPANELFERSVKLGLQPPIDLQGWADFELHNKITPWITKKFYNKVMYLKDFILPYISDVYRERHIDKFHTVQYFFHKLAQFRFKHRFFYFPLEYKIYKFYTTRREKRSRVVIEREIMREVHVPIMAEHVITTG